MAAKVVICPAEVAHADALAPAMRPADVAEVRASGGYGPRDALVACLEWSREAYAGYIDGELAALFGVGAGSFLSGAYIPWALTTGVVDRKPRAFVEASRLFIEIWLERYGALEQMVDARHTKALRWLAHLGFTVDAPTLWGVEGRPFCRVHQRRIDRV